MNNDKALIPQVVVTPRPSEEAYQNLSEYVTAILNGIEKARNPEAVRIDIVAMRISRVYQDKNNN